MNVFGVEIISGDMRSLRFYALHLKRNYKSVDSIFTALGDAEAEVVENLLLLFCARNPPDLASKIFNMRIPT